MRNLFAVSLVVALLLVGCGAAPELKQLVRDQATNSDADLKDYRAGKLTPAQVDQHFYDHAASWAAANYAVNGVPLPAQYAPPVAPVTTAGTSK